MRDRKRVYLEIWSRIESLYFDGYMANERTLQAELYAELRNTLPDVHVVAEPAWTVGSDTKKKYPDLVIVEKGQITDIFELKMWDVNDVKLRKDIEKLLRYGVQENSYQIGEWGHLPVWHACRLHSVVVDKHNGDAVWPTYLRGVVGNLRENDRELGENPRVLSHWFGRIEGDTDETREWSIEFGI